MTADYQTYDTDRLAHLMNSVTRLDPYGRWCQMTDGGETLLVQDSYCPFCNAVHGFVHDGRGDCVHKAALERAWRAEMEARDRDREDEQAQRQAVAWGVA
jgi:hypothetical protein